MRRTRHAIIASMVFTAIAGSVSLTARPANAAPCDLVLSFESVDGRINRPAYEQVGAWLKANPQRTAGVVETAFPDGARSLCLTAPTRSEIGPLFKEIGTLLPENKDQPGFSLLNTASGRSDRKSSRVRGRGYAGERHPPRDNGVSNRPPIGVRN